ncbi:MAG TPA: PAS domain S-box protein [Gemmataceae bacterium]|nr:PAS domain S-box protein [Gemmataceae bacterium]
MTDSRSTPPKEKPPPKDRRWLLAVAGLLLVALSNPLPWNLGRTALLSAPLGLGLALIAWLGYRVLALISLVLLLLPIVVRGATSDIWREAIADALLTSAEIGVGWWCYCKAGGTRRLDDPRSTTLFLLLVPGAVGGIFATLEAWILPGNIDAGNFTQRVLGLWIDSVLGILALTPVLLAVATPWLVYYRLALADPTEPRFVVHPRLTWTLGDVLETAGLAIGASIVGLVLAALHAGQQQVPWHWLGLLLLIIVWASLRLGLRGGSLVAGLATLVALVAASYWTDNPALMAPLRGSLLAQCSTALLIGASADWIRRSETRYRQVVGQIPVVLYSGRFLRMPGPGAKPEVEILFVSRAATQVLGCEPDSLLGDFRAWLERIHPMDRELVQAALGQLMLQKQPVTCEYRLAEAKPPPEESATGQILASNPMIDLARNLAQATQRYVRDRLAPHYGADGQLDGWEGVVEDITEQRQLAQDLRRTTNMLQALVQNLPTGVYFVHGANGRPLMVNARARKLLGQREDLSAGLNHLSAIYRLHKPDGQPYPWEELPVSKALRDGATCMCDDIVVYRPDGRRIPLVTWAAPVDLGGHGGHDSAVWVLEDLTALRQSEEQYRVLVESLPIMLLQFDGHGSLDYHNPAAEQITGYSGESLRQHGFWQSCIHADDAANFNGLLDAAAAGQRTRAEFRYHAADGCEKTGYALAQPRRPKGATVLVVDMTQRRRLEQEIQKVQRLELVGRIASGVVHDFNNLLSVIVGHAELGMKTVDHQPVRTDLEHILQATEQAKRLASQLLTFSKQRRVVMRPVDLYKVTKNALDLLKPTLPVDIEVEMRGRDEQVIVQADDAPLQQVVLNLCLNARDAMPEGGRLLVETACEPMPPGNHIVAGTVGLTDGVRPCARLTIADSGCGMDDTVQARIFEPLFTTKERGSGLGLAVVKQIVEGFGGCIRVDSAPGKGTRFDVWLPTTVE